jgi:REP element-mobilizing transposase RayT
MAIAHHVIMSFYGFWLPNDLRGSWSDFVGAWELFRFGRATKVQTRRSVAALPHDRPKRLAAKRALKHPPVVLTGRQALAVGRGFKEAAAAGGYRVYACSILPEHAHMVLAAGEQPPSRMVGHLKGKATLRLYAEGQWCGGRPVWAHGSWRVYLDRPEDVRGAIEYVEGNPAKEGKPPHRWSFVRPFRP